MKEKSLTNQNKFNIFQKIRMFLNKIFYKNTEIKNETISYNDDKNILDELKRQNKFIQLQEKYEKGNIKEEELSEDEKEELLNLYKKQIKNLEQNVNKYQKELENYKCKIIKKKNQFNFNN